MAKVPEIKDLKTKPSPSGGTCSFKVAKGFDFKSQLDEFADAGNEHIAGWEQVN